MITFPKQFSVIINILSCQDHTLLEVHLLIRKSNWFGRRHVHQAQLHQFSDRMVALWMEVISQSLDIRNRIIVQKFCRHLRCDILLLSIFSKGILANNPTLDVLSEIAEYNQALRSVDRADEVMDPEVVVSLGTGISPVRKVRNISIPAFRRYI